VCNEAESVVSRLKCCSPDDPTRRVIITGDLHGMMKPLEYATSSAT
jgi:hypothetical protein